MSDVLPPPPPQRGGNGCWKWGAISCGIGCLGLLIAFAVLLMVTWPTVQTMLKAQEKGDQVKRDMRLIAKAIDAYAADKGRYPSALKDLVPSYLPDGRSLRPSADPSGPAYLYLRPPANAPGSHVLLQYELPPPVPGGPPWVIRLRKDGVIEGGDYDIESVMRQRPAPGRQRP